LCFYVAGLRREVTTLTRASETRMAVVFYTEVGMQFMKCSTGATNSDVISGILNCVCPECGGRMGGRGLEFKCQGQCLTDWHPVWELALSGEFDGRPKRAIRVS
jgi:hypothetical protein